VFCFLVLLPIDLVKKFVLEVDVVVEFTGA